MPAVAIFGWTFLRQDLARGGVSQFMRILRIAAKSVETTTPSSRWCHGETAVQKLRSHFLELPVAFVCDFVPNIAAKWSD